MRSAFLKLDSGKLLGSLLQRGSHPESFPTQRLPDALMIRRQSSSINQVVDRVGDIQKACSKALCCSFESRGGGGGGGGWLAPRRFAAGCWCPEALAPGAVSRPLGNKLRRSGRLRGVKNSKNEVSGYFLNNCDKSPGIGSSKKKSCIRACSAVARLEGSNVRSRSIRSNA